MKRRTNDDVAEALGCDFTTVSKLRTGDRLPSLAMLSKIREVYGLDGNALLDAYNAGAIAFSTYLRSMVFEPTEDGHP